MRVSRSRAMITIVILFAYLTAAVFLGLIISNFVLMHECETMMPMPLSTTSCTSTKKANAVVRTHSYTVVCLRQLIDVQCLALLLPILSVAPLLLVYSLCAAHIRIPSASMKKSMWFVLYLVSFSHSMGCIRKSSVIVSAILFKCILEFINSVPYLASSSEMWTFGAPLQTLIEIALAAPPILVFLLLSNRPAVPAEASPRLKERSTSELNVRLLDVSIPDSLNL